jgi:hypothetical protein
LSKRVTLLASHDKAKWRDEGFRLISTTIKLVETVWAPFIPIPFLMSSKKLGDSQLVDERAVEELPLHNRDLTQVTYLYLGSSRSFGRRQMTGFGERAAGGATYLGNSH